MPTHLETKSKPAHEKVRAKRPTITDVAKLAGVGGSTVSRYLRGGVNVSPEVADKVADAIKRLGYELDETARALRSGRSRTIGIVIPQVANTFFSRTVQLIEEEATKRGSAVILLTHQEQLERQAQQLATLRRYRVDGVMVTAAPGSKLKDIEVALPGVPCVAFDRLFSSELDTILLRNREAAHTATEHLLRHGHKSIACVTAKPQIFTFRERIVGYTEAAEHAGCAVHLIEATDYRQLRYSISGSISNRKAPTALLSLSNMATISILETFEELGLRRDQRPAVVGFDDFDVAALVDPPLTVMRQPVETMVQYALDILFRRIENKSKFELQTISLPAELVCRRSCGCS